MPTAMVPVQINLNLEWTNYRSGLGINAMSFILAVAIHAPIFFMKLDMHKPMIEHKQDRLLEGINIINEIPKPEVAPPPPAPKKASWKDKLAKLVHKEPPPPPPPPKAAAPEKLATPQNQIALAPKLEMPKLAQTLESKKNFQASQPKMLEEKKIDLKPMNPSIAAPLTQGKVGFQDKGPSKTSKESFTLAKNTSLSSIGTGSSIADPSAPSIAIQTGKANKEGWSAAPPSSLKDKGKAGFSGSSLSTPKNMTLREQALAQANAASQIAIGNSQFSRAGGAAGGVEGGVGTKKDAGRYEGGSFGGVAGGVPGGVAGGTGSSLASGIKGGSGISSGASTKPKEKKSMFQITGPLKDRPIEKKVTPEYPSWAREQGIEASVVLEFVVTSDGIVKDNIVPIRSSGYTKLDETAMKALRQWKFAPLSDGRNEEQVGRITFNYQIF